MEAIGNVVEQGDRCYRQSEDALIASPKDSSGPTFEAVRNSRACQFATGSSDSPFGTDGFHVLVFSDRVIFGYLSLL